MAVLGVSIDLNKRLVPTFVEAAGFNFPVAYGSAAMVRESPLGAVRGVPRTLVLDTKGRVKADYYRIVDTAELLKVLKPLLR